MQDTAERLLDAAQVLVQQRGFNAFSFRDLTGPLKITNAGIHYHFPTKADLGRALVARYRRNFATLLAEVDQTADSAKNRLHGFVDLYADVLRGGRLCLCGMLASDAATLPAEVQESVRGFFTATEAWLADVLEEGRAAGNLQFEGSAADEAALLLATIEGAMLIAWSFRSQDPDQALKQFEAVMQSYLSRLLIG